MTLIDLTFVDGDFTVCASVVLTTPTQVGGLIVNTLPTVLAWFVHAKVCKLTKSTIIPRCTLTFISCFLGDTGSIVLTVMIKTEIKVLTLSACVSLYTRTIIIPVIRVRKTCSPVKAGVGSTDVFILAHLAKIVGGTCALVAVNEVQARCSILTRFVSTFIDVV